MMVISNKKRSVIPSFSAGSIEGIETLHATPEEASQDSPIFGIDCEMCVTLSRQSALTRIAVVNEELEVVYHTLVKPGERIVDYATKVRGGKNGGQSNFCLVWTVFGDYESYAGGDNDQRGGCEAGVGSHFATERHIGRAFCAERFCGYEGIQV